MSFKDCIGNAGRIKRAGIAETVIIKLHRQREFFSFKTGIPSGLGHHLRNSVSTNYQTPINCITKKITVYVQHHRLGSGPNPLYYTTVKLSAVLSI